MYGFPILYIHLKTSHSEWVMSDWPLCVITILSILNICFTNLCMKPKVVTSFKLSVKIMEEKMSLINRKFTAVMLFGMFLYSGCKPCINVNPLIPPPLFHIIFYLYSMDFTKGGSSVGAPGKHPPLKIFKGLFLKMLTS